MPNNQLEHVINAQRQVNWERLMEQALTVKGSTTGIYERFYRRGYSMGNKILLMLQGADGPVNSLPRWNKMGRYVIRGSKAFSIMVPMTYKEKLEDGTERTRLRGFKLSPTLFTASQTKGEELPEAEPINWSKERAIDSLELVEEPFTMLDGNVQGYSHGRTISVSPVAAQPMPTWLHEASHIVAGHTAEGNVEQYRSHRGIYELEAEGSAYVLINELEVATDADLSESRAYIQGWIGRQEPPQSSFKTIFKTVDTILRAGRADVEEVAAA